MISSCPTPEQVHAWLESIHATIRELDAAVEPLLVERTRLTDRAVILKELLASFGDVTAAEIPDVPAPPGAALGATSPQRGRETVRDRVHREVLQVLDEIGRPLHINDLVDEYVKRGCRIPGQGKPANLSVHLSGWDDIVSPERGIYGLVQFFPDLLARRTAGSKTVRRRKKGSR